MKLENQIYSDRRAWFLSERNKMFKEQQVDIVQIGDSITEGWNIARYIPTNQTIINSGIGGDVSDLLLRRLDRDCFNYNPSKIILMVGINDIRTYFKDEQFIKRTSERQLIEEVSNNIIAIIEACKDYEIVWCEILPINEFKFNSYYINTVIEVVNEKVRNHVLDYRNVKVVRFDELIIYDGRLDSNVTFDGLHPNDDAYYQMTLKIKSEFTNKA